MPEDRCELLPRSGSLQETEFPVLEIDEKLNVLMTRGYFLIASLEITRRCNAACRYCYLPDEKETPEISTAQVKLAIDKLFDAGILSIGITGGEPMLRQDFNELLEYILQKGFYFVSLLTNGVLLRTLSPRRSSAIVKWGSRCACRSSRWPR